MKEVILNVVDLIGEYTRFAFVRYCRQTILDGNDLRSIYMCIHCDTINEGREKPFYEYGCVNALSCLYAEFAVCIVHSRWQH